MIVQMKRVTLVAHNADEASLLSALQAAQSVEVIGEKTEAPDLTALERAEEQVQSLKQALVTLRPFAEKRGFFSAPPEASAAEIGQTLPGGLAISKNLEAISRELSTVRAEMDKNDTLITALRPWEDFPADMQTFQNVRGIKYFTGVIASSDVEKLSAIEETAEYQLFNEGSMRTCIVACALDEAKSIANFLKSIAWADYSFPKMSGTPAEAMTELAERSRVLAARKFELETALAEEAKGASATIESALDAAVIARDRAAAAAELARSSATFQLEGWAPADKTEAVERAIRGVTDAYYFAVRDAEEGEVPPSYVENKKLVAPFEAVTNLYSRPDPNGIDAAPYMAPFYVLLFGMMLSDSGYGLVLSILCALFLKFKKPKGGAAGFARVLFWGGLSTVIWGVLIGTVFGLDFDVLLGTKDMFPLILDPMTDPIGMLIICFGLGFFHILFGLSLKVKLAFSRGDWKTAVFDTLSWMILLVGLVAFGLASALKSVPQIIRPIGLGMTILGAATLLLFKGRDSKNVVGRTATGLFELYQISGYLSDILSYSRLFALGVATGVIATVFNNICSMLMNSPNVIFKVLGIIVGSALLLALHSFSLAINTLGAFVHCARLQYVEFFGKFYEAGGRPFKPLGYRTSHVRITDASASATNS